MAGLCASVLSIASCSRAQEGGQPGLGPATPQVDVGVAEIHPLYASEAELKASDVAELRAFDRAVPDEAPPYAVAVAAYIEGATTNVLRLVDGRIKTRVVAANVGSNRASGNLVCLIEAEQVPCNRSFDVARIDLGVDTVAVVGLDVGARPGARIDVLLLMDGDADRPSPTARRLVAYADRVDDSVAAPIDPPAAEPVYGGCGFVTVVDSLDEEKTFIPPTSVRAGTDVWALAQICEEDNPGPLRLVLIADRRSVVPIRDTMWQRALDVKGTVALSVPRDVLEPGREYQVVALRLGSTDPPSWVSHPVVAIDVRSD